jgi:hypothetical protein
MRVYGGAYSSRESRQRLSLCAFALPRLCPQRRPRADWPLRAQAVLAQVLLNFQNTIMSLRAFGEIVRFVLNLTVWPGITDVGRRASWRTSARAV